MAGYSGRSVVQKLGIKPGFCIFVDGSLACYAEIIGPLPADGTLVPRLKAPLDDTWSGLKLVIPRDQRARAALARRGK